MFYDALLAATEAERNDLIATPIIREALAGRVTRDQYLGFLAQAYHHVRHTVPLLMACGLRLPERLAWMRAAVVDYIEEEAGHDEWILNDIDCAGGDAAAVRAGAPAAATEVMVAYAYDGILRRNPVSFFGMAMVLEGTSVALAGRAATVLQEALGLPAAAFTYLSSHGAIDVAHTETFAGLVNRFDAEEDRRDLIHAARIFYRLYGDVFRDLDGAAAA